MFQIQGLKSTIISLIGTSALFAGVWYLQPHWQNRLHLVDTLIYPFLLVTALFAAQFNRSRITLLAALWALFLATTQELTGQLQWLKENQTWLILSGGGLFAMLSLVKDRGLLSSHGLFRIIFIGLCGALAFGWLKLLEQYNEKLTQLPLMPKVLPYLPLTVPLGLLAAVLLWRSISQRNLTTPALAATFILWYLTHHQWLSLPWSIVVAALTCVYLLSVIIESYFLAYRDDLTGIPTRRALNQLALSLGRKYTVAMMDIDHFKKFNDTYGHDIGDQVLKLVAAKLTTVKGGGKVFRYGGEEFTVVFPGKTPEQAVEALEQLRQTIADYKMVVRQEQRSNKKSRQKQKPANQKTVSVTVSIGVAARAPKQSFEQTLKAADQALYRAKDNGRNNVSQ